MEKTYYTGSFGPSADPRHNRIFCTVQSRGLCPVHFEMSQVKGLPPFHHSHWETIPQLNTYSLTHIFLRAHPNFSSLHFILWPSSWKRFCSLLCWYENCIYIWMSIYGFITPIIINDLGVANGCRGTSFPTRCLAAPSKSWPQLLKPVASRKKGSVRLVFTVAWVVWSPKEVGQKRLQSYSPLCPAKPYSQKGHKTWGMEGTTWQWWHCGGFEQSKFNTSSMVLATCVSFCASFSCGKNIMVITLTRLSIRLCREKIALVWICWDKAS